MSVVHLKRSDASVDRLVKVAFPEYKGTKVQANITDSIQFYGTNWDGGNRRTYVLIELASMRAVQVSQAPFLEHSTLHDKPQPIPDGYVVVVWVESRYEHIEIHSPAANLSGLLPVKVELTENERVVLIATRSLKSSYGGISNYRWHEAGRSRGISLEEWEATKVKLVARGYLARNGAITVDGKNAVGNEQL